MEKDITVSGRPKDQKLLQKAVEQAASEFKDKAGFEVQCEVDDKLGDKSCVLASLSGFSLEAYMCNPDRHGGVLLRGYGSRITVNNTLDERLRLLQERMLPEIRESLFGKNENRRFYS